MKKPNIMTLYERWLDRVGVNHSYAERLGALAILLWLKDNNLLKGE